MSSSTFRLAILGDSTHPNIERWNRGLQAAGAETYVLSLRHRATRAQFPTYWLPTIRLLGRQFSYLLAIPSTRRFLQQWKPDVVLAYYTTGYGTLGRLCGFHPLVQVTSGSDVLLAHENFLMRILVHRNLSSADLVTSWAPHMAQEARLLGAKEVFILPAGIDTDRFRAHRITRPTPEASPRLIITRTLKAFYRIDRLIEAMRILRERGVRCSLTIAGEGPERSTLADMVNAYNLQEQVTLVGFVPNEALPPLLAKHNTYISLVPSDGVSASLLEAMSIGLMPIVPDHPANSDWIKHGENGYLLTEDTPDTIATMIEYADYRVRVSAWEKNPLIISERADLYRNSQLYIDLFRQIARNS